MRQLPQQYLLCLLFGIGFASASQSGFDRLSPVTAGILIGGSLFYGVLLLITITMLVISCLKRRRPKYDLEARPLITSDTPMPVDNVTVYVSSEHRSYLLSEVKSDEVLAWAFEPVIQNRRAIDAFGSSGVALIASFIFFIIQIDSTSNRTWPFLLAVGCFISWTMLFLGACYRLIKTDMKLYGVTSKRVFMIVLTPKFRKPYEVISISSDYEGLQQISVTRKEDGSGTLTFSLSIAGSYPIKSNPYANPYAFENIPNVTQVKDLIEGFKRSHQKV